MTHEVPIQKGVIEELSEQITQETDPTKKAELIETADGIIKRMAEDILRGDEGLEGLGSLD